MLSNHLDNPNIIKVYDVFTDIEFDNDYENE